MIPAVKKILVLMLISAVLCISAAGFVRFFFYMAHCSESTTPADWTIRNETAAYHPLEAVRDETGSSPVVYNISSCSHSSVMNAWQSVLRLLMKIMTALGLCLCCLRSVCRASSVRWIHSTFSHSYIISYIFRLSAYDRSSLCA